jgi:hypothetical protein
VCRDRKVELVYASELEAAEAENARLRDENTALHAFARHFAGTVPRNGQWEASYRSMQERAKAALASHPVAGRVAAPAAEGSAPPPDASRTREA